MTNRPTHGCNHSAMRCAVFLLLALVLGCAACKPEQPTLTLLVWEGYADPSFIGAFEESHHCKVVASYMGQAMSWLPSARRERFQL